MSRRQSLPETEWPEMDRALLGRLLSRGGLFEEVGPLAHLRPISQDDFKTAYGRWLAWLAREEPSALLEPPVERATPERVQNWLASLGHLAPISRHTLLNHVLRVLRSAAPEADWSAQARLLSLLRCEAMEHRSGRKDGRIVSTAVLFQAALERSRSLGQGSAPTRLRTAGARRDATMVAFLAVLPIRRRAFCSLELGRSLVRQAGAMAVVLDASMTKTGQPWEAAVPAPLAELLADYLEQVRPVLLGRAQAPTQALWLNDGGRSYSPRHLADRIREITKGLVGVSVPPQLFRDCAATTLAYDSPQSARLTRALLGHTTFRTAEQHYNQATGIEAGRRYADLVARLANRTS